MSKPFYDAFPSGITSWNNLSSFATDARGLNASITDPAVLNIPYTLSSSLVAKAAATHAALDIWTPPPTLKVTSIAGWGQLTAYSYNYAQYDGHQSCSIPIVNLSCQTILEFTHEPQLTEDGDGTIVSQSTIGDIGQVQYFNAKQFQLDTNQAIVHQDLTSAISVQNVLKDLFEGTNVIESYIQEIKPVAKRNPLTVIGGKSPVNIVASDSAGNETGIVPIPESEGLYFAKRDIPGSAALSSGEEKFVYLPQGTLYSIDVTGYADGPANIEIQNLDANGNLTASTTIADIPVTASTTITFSLDAAGLPSSILIDLNGDGTTDATVTPQIGTSTPFVSAVSPIDYINYMMAVIKDMSLDWRIARQLHVKLSDIAHLIANADNKWNKSRGDDDRNDTHNSRFLESSLERKIRELEAYVNHNSGSKGRRYGDSAQKYIPADDLAQILAMITELRLIVSNL